MKYTENQSWVVWRGGDIMKKKAKVGLSGLNDMERLIHCLWVSDYMMRNAGDFANAVAIYLDFQKDAKRLAKSLGLPQTFEAFSLSRQKLEREYFERFETICDEIKKADQLVT